MTSATAAETETEQYDPDNPPEDRGFLGTFTISANVTAQGVVTPSYGAEDERIVAAVRQYTQSPKVNYGHEVWYLEGEAIDVVRSDGQPFRVHDIIKTRSNQGNNLGANQTPAKLAAAFREHGLSASPLKVGTSESAVGRIFQFTNKDIELGGGYKKGVRMFPKELMPEDFVFTGEPRVITPKSSDGDSGAPVDGGASSAPSEPEVIEILKVILNGRLPSSMMDIVLADGRLSGVSTVFGVPLLESATDESLAQVLVENKAMTMNAAGYLVAA